MQETGRWTLPSEAVVYRTIEDFQPTLLLDEIDAIFKERNADRHEGLRALLNSGNRRGATVPRCVSPSHTLMMFPTFCPKAFAGIGVPPDTVADRSIPIRLKRRIKSEKVERFRLRDKRVTGDAEALKIRMENWAKQNLQSLESSYPDLPEELSDRQQEAVEPLLAIADLAGEDWGVYTRVALIDILAGDTEQTETLQIQLIADLKERFQDYAMEWIPSETVIFGLTKTEPWNGGNSADEKPLSQKKLSWFLSHFDIHPKNIHFDDGTQKRSYEMAKLRDAWERYAPDSEKTE